MPLSEPLLTEQKRFETYPEATGIYVRARHMDKPMSVDIAQLDRASLLRWMRKDGGRNPIAENTVALLLHHEPYTLEELLAKESA